jgi:hypothetical protein
MAYLTAKSQIRAILPYTSTRVCYLFSNKAFFGALTIGSFLDFIILQGSSVDNFSIYGVLKTGTWPMCLFHDNQVCHTSKHECFSNY